MESLSEPDQQKVKAYISKLKNNSDKSLSDRWVLFPLQDQLSWRFYKEQESVLWKAHEADFTVDTRQFNDGTLNERQRQIFKEIMGFFVAADGGIADNVGANNIDPISKEESILFDIMKYIENVHAESYNRFAEKVLPDLDEYQSIINMCNSRTCQARKMEFIDKYMNSSEDRILRYVASCCMEGIFFLGIFPIIFYFIRHNLLPGFTQLNQLIFRDETIHYRYYLARLSHIFSEHLSLREEYSERIHQIILEAEDIEQQFIQFLLQTPLFEDQRDVREGLSLDKMTNYVKVMVNNTLSYIGYPQIYDLQPEDADLPWMGVAINAGKTNKYDLKVTEYASSGGLDKRLKDDLKAGTGKKETQRKRINF